MKAATPTIHLKKLMKAKFQNRKSQKNRKKQNTSFPRKKLKFTYKEQKEYETIESDIAALEEKLENTEKEMTLNATDFVKLEELSKIKEETENLLNEKMERWEYLEDLNQKIQEQNKK